MKKTSRHKTINLSSTPCFSHEVVDTVEGISVIDPQQALDVSRWRKSERQRLKDLRQSISLEERQRNTQIIIQQLDSLVTQTPATIVSTYWPIMGEPNLRHWMKELQQRGTKIALPVVESPASPMIFREWAPGARMQPGIWNIPVPVDGDLVVPTLVIAPVVGFDAGNYRLGYGGGYFDRTLAKLITQNRRPYVIGVGYECLRVPTIFPQAHDIPMDVIITERVEPDLAL